MSILTYEECNVKYDDYLNIAFYVVFIAEDLELKGTLLSGSKHEIKKALRYDIFEGKNNETQGKSED